jgi:hypothetical protein
VFNVNHLNSECIEPIVKQIDLKDDKEKEEKIKKSPVADTTPGCSASFMSGLQ